MARMNMPLELSCLRLSEPLLDHGAPYSGIGFHELKLLLPYLSPNWNGKLNPLPKVLAGRTHWQYGSRNHASDSSRMLGSINVTAILDDGTNDNISHDVMKKSSQRIVGRSITTKYDFIHTDRNYLKLPDDSRIPLQTAEFTLTCPMKYFSRKRVFQS